MNKNIKQLIERLFDDNDDILLDGIDDVPIADMLQIAAENARKSVKKFLTFKNANAKIDKPH